MRRDGPGLLPPRVDVLRFGRPMSEEELARIRHDWEVHVMNQPQAVLILDEGATYEPLTRAQVAGIFDLAPEDLFSPEELEKL